jgi:hypothetical protein
MRPLPYALGAWLLMTLMYFRGGYSAERFRLKEGRPWILKAAAYLGAVPLRLLLSAFSAGVATLVWGLLALFVWALWKAAQG